MDGRTTELLARLDALAARLDEQAATITAQAEQIDRLKAATLPTGTPTRSSSGAEPKVGRRGMLTKMLGATAAAAVLTVAKEAATARADARSSNFTGGVSTAQYGLAARPRSRFDPGTPTDPVDAMGNIPATRQYGVIGAESNPGITPPDGAGVLGQAFGYYGVIGLSNQGHGVFGRSTSATGVRGESSSGVGTIGSSGGNIGVYGASSQNVGVFGDADVNTAVMGRTGAGIGVYGTATRPGQGGRAAVFDGTVLVNGPFTVVGGPKSAGVKLPDGGVGRVYCQESPEPYFEDFGKGQLAAGKATVRLDPQFAAIVKADDYLVFLTEIGSSTGLYVADLKPNTFEVRSNVATAGSAFHYRVVARRRDDVGKRLEKVDVRPAQSKDVKPPDLSIPVAPTTRTPGPDEPR